MRNLISAGIFTGAALLLTLTGCGADAASSQSEAVSARTDCSLVRCALPVCAEGQRLANVGGSCCPTCVGPEPRCAAVLCAAVVCPEGSQLVTSPGDCCGRCAPIPPAAECVTDSDCPQLQCLRCPCPVSSCQGRSCVTRTPAESTCGAL
jgi:hypothetical protein